MKNVFIKILWVAFICLILIIGLVFVGLRIAGNYFQEKLDLTITNKTKHHISVHLRVTDLDVNLTNEKKIDEMGDIQPGNTKSASVFLDGLAPEVCEVIIVKSEGGMKEYPCGQRTQAGKAGFLTKTNLLVQF
jgi:hypothetical protein